MTIKIEQLRTLIRDQTQTRGLILSVWGNLAKLTDLRIFQFSILFSRIVLRRITEDKCWSVFQSYVYIGTQPPYEFKRN